MAIFEIQGPDGSIYEVDAPDEASAAAAFGEFSATPSDAPANGPDPQIPVASPPDMGAVPPPQVATQPAPKQPSPMDALTAAAQFGTAFGSSPEARAEVRRELIRDEGLLSQIGTTLNDNARLVADGATFGYADKLAARANSILGGDTYEQELARQREETQGSMDRQGWAGTAAQVGGAVAAAPGTLTTYGTGLAAKTGLGALEGAGYGALSAAGHDQNIATGAAAGATGGALAAPVAAVAQGITSKIGRLFGGGADDAVKAVPTADEISAAKRAAYNKAEQAGISFKPEAIANLQGGVVDDLTRFGYDPALMPGAAPALKRLEDLVARETAPSLQDLDLVRKVANNGFIPGNKANNAAIQKITGRIDELMENGSPEALAGGDEAGLAALREGRKLHGTERRLEEVKAAKDRADLRAASTGSGGNADNATRQSLRRIVEKGARGYSDLEKEALLKAIQGTRGQNALRLAGKFAPTGVVSGVLSGGAGVGLAGPFGIALPLAGGVAKTLADRATARNYQELIDVIASGGASAGKKATPANPATRDAIIKVLTRALPATGY